MALSPTMTKPPPPDRTRKPKDIFYYEEFDSVDTDSHVSCREQAYAFYKRSDKVFKLKLAVFDPTILLPYREKNKTVGDFLKNLDMICRLGREEASFTCENKNSFLSDFSTGTRYQYLKRLNIRGKKPDYIVYAAKVDFNKSPLIDECISDFEIEKESPLRITTDSFATYGVDYSLYGDKESDNILAARAFETSGRSNNDMKDKYSSIRGSREAVDTLGRFVVWGTGLVIKKAAAQYCIDHPLHLIAATADKKNDHLLTYSATRKHYLENGKLLAGVLTTPLSDPEAFLNAFQALSMRDIGHPMLGPKEIDRLIPELQARYDAGNPQPAPERKPVDFNNLPNLKIVGMLPPEALETSSWVSKRRQKAFKS
jgi:hypothetical protein